MLWRGKSVLTSYFICLALFIPWLNCRGSGAHFHERSLRVRGVKAVLFLGNKSLWLDPTGAFQSQHPFVIGFTELPGIHLTRKTTALTQHLMKGLSGPFMAQWRNTTSQASFEATVWKSSEFNVMYLFILLTHPVYKVTLLTHNVRFIARWDYCLNLKSLPIGSCLECLVHSVWHSLFWKLWSL